MTLLIITAIAALFAVSGLRKAADFERAVVFTFGKYNRLKGPGVFWIFPLVENYHLVDIRIASIGIDQQETRSKDNVIIKINAVMWYKILQPNEALLNTPNYKNTICELAGVGLRTIVSRYTYEEVLNNRENLNIALQKFTDTQTEPFGVKIKMAELKDLEAGETVLIEHKINWSKARLSLN